MKIRIVLASLLLAVFAAGSQAAENQALNRGLSLAYAAAGNPYESASARQAEALDTSNAANNFAIEASTNTGENNLKQAYTYYRCPELKAGDRLIDGQDLGAGLAGHWQARLFGGISAFEIKHRHWDTFSPQRGAGFVNVRELMCGQHQQSAKAGLHAVTAVAGAERQQAINCKKLSDADQASAYYPKSGIKADFVCIGE